MNNFTIVINDPNFKNIFINTITIGFYRTIFLFIFSLFISNLIIKIQNNLLRNFYIFLIIFSTFLSWIVVAGIFRNLFSLEGLVNTFFNSDISFFTNIFSFKVILFYSILWKDSGILVLLFCQALSGIDSNILEASSIDGANTIQQFFKIKIPLIKSHIETILILLLLSFSSGVFDPIFNMYNATLYEYVDIFDTYVYRSGIITGKFSLGAALELIKNTINIAFSFLLFYKINKELLKTESSFIEEYRFNEKNNIFEKILLFIVALFFLLPYFSIFIYTFISSKSIFSQEIPLSFTFENLNVLKNKDFIHSLIVSFCTSSIGAILSVILTILLAYGFFQYYPIRKKVRIVELKTFFFIISFNLFFNGGIISLYILLKHLKIINSYFALFLPFLLNNIITIYVLMDLRKIDSEIIEAYKIDGAGYLVIFLEIVLKLRRKLIIYLGIIFFIIHWNNWYPGLLFIHNKNMEPVNIFLRKILFSDSNIKSIFSVNVNVTINEKMTYIFGSILPIIFLFVFFIFLIKRKET